MADDVIVRPLVATDVVDADAIGFAVLGAPYGMVHDEVLKARGRARIAHLIDTDPGGCWAAERDGHLVALAISLIREGVWGFSLFAVRPEEHRAGVGTQVFAPSLAYGAGCHGGIICSSEHPAAMRLYARAGFRLLPSVEAAGVVDRRGLPAGLRARPGDLLDEADRETCALASRAARGASHDVDLETFLQGGAELLVLPGRGFALHRAGSPALLAALDADAAEDLILSCLAAAPLGGTVELSYVTAGNDWAVAAALRCRLALTPGGPLFVRGSVGPAAPYIPSGAYL